jgi:hypothetical protein
MSKNMRTSLTGYELLLRCHVVEDWVKHLDLLT